MCTNLILIEAPVFYCLLANECLSQASSAWNRIFLEKRQLPLQDPFIEMKDTFFNHPQRSSTYKLTFRTKTLRWEVLDV